MRKHILQPSQRIDIEVSRFTLAIKMHAICTSSQGRCQSVPTYLLQADMQRGSQPGFKKGKTRAHPLRGRWCKPDRHVESSSGSLDFGGLLPWTWIPFDVAAQKQQQPQPPTRTARELAGHEVQIKLVIIALPQGGKPRRLVLAGLRDRSVSRRTIAPIEL